jgi:hypothetical protein
MNRSLETNRTVSIRPVAAVVAVPGRAMLPLPQGAPFNGKLQPCRLVVVALRPLGKSQALRRPLTVHLRIQL